jgi:cytochrome c-type biogenesis protein CcmF
LSEFGNFCLLLAFCMAIYSVFAAVLGAVQKQHRIVRSVERAALASCGLIALALGSLVYLLVSSDFSVTHVATASNRALPVYYKIAALWGAHDGSMLLWSQSSGTDHDKLFARTEITWKRASMPGLTPGWSFKKTHR